jgi:hypothetical protein
VLAEWVATVQDRVGRFLGVLGKDDIDYSAVPAIMLLEEEDIKLLQKVADILHNADMKLAYDISSNALPMLGGLSNLGHCGYGTKLLMVTAYMLSKAAVWPGKFRICDSNRTLLTLHSHTCPGSRSRGTCQPHQPTRRELFDCPVNTPNP